MPRLLVCGLGVRHGDHTLQPYNYCTRSFTLGNFTAAEVAELYKPKTLELLRGGNTRDRVMLGRDRQRNQEWQ